MILNPGQFTEASPPTLAASVSGGGFHLLKKALSSITPPVTTLAAKMMPL
jgi:hypothetical protein